VNVLGAIVATSLAGALGAVVRAALVTRSPRAGTAFVNVVGTVTLALTLVAHGRGMLGTAAAVVLGVGFSGSLTTFSGWMAVLADGFVHRPVVTALVDLLLPSAAAVGLSVAVFAMLG
jgi:fluoride ion exporter CrcB/FEX